MKALLVAGVLGVIGLALPAWSETVKVVDVPSRPGVTQRVLVLRPERPQAAVLLFAGGHGGLQITPAGGLTWAPATSSSGAASSSRRTRSWSS
jgi:hypothetical protein